MTPIPCTPPATENGAYFALAGGPPTVVSSGVSITVNAAKNHAAGSNSLLTVTYNASAAVAQLVQNTTHASRAWIYKNVSGNEYTTTQPMVLNSIGGPSAPAEVDTWATNDTVNLLQPVQVNIVDFEPVREDYAAYTNSSYIYQLTIFDPLGGGQSSVVLGTGVNVYESRSQRIISGGRFSEDWFLGLANFFDDGGIRAATGVDWFGGALPSTAIFTEIAGYFSEFDGDAIIGGTNYLYGQSGWGQVYIDGLINIAPGGDAVIEQGQYGGNYIYGSAAGNFEPDHATVRYHQGAGGAATYFTAPNLISPGFKLNFEPQTVGCVLLAGGASLTTAPSGTCNVAVTVANLDANLGASIGCIGAPNGGSVCNEL